MRFIDTHSHIYDTGFQEDMDLVMSSAKLSGIEKIYMPNIDSTCINAMMDMETKYPGICIPMMGLHPCYVKENYQEELAIVEEWLAKRKFAAIGEIGLDYYWDKTFEKEQQLVFEKQMQWGLDYDLPINIHTRNAMGETIEMVKPFAKKGLKGIFHCFSGSKESAEQITSMGFLLGLGGVLTYKNAGIAEAVKDIPMEFLVLEKTYKEIDQLEKTIISEKSFTNKAEHFLPLAIAAAISLLSEFLLKRFVFKAIP